MRFILIGDTKGKVMGINERVLKKLLSLTHGLKYPPDFIVICGDSVAGSKSAKELEKQLIRFKSIMEGFHPGKPIIPVLGNHEVNIDPQDDRYERIFSRVYSDLKQDGYLEGYNHTAYYFDHDDTRFFILNAFHPGETHRISDNQLKWFEDNARVYKKNKLVFVHSPAYPTGAHFGHCLDLYPDSRDEFWEIIDRCSIDIVFSGHEHNYTRRIITPDLNQIIHCRNSITQIITGGGGEKLRNKFTSKEGVIVGPIDKYHFLVVDIIHSFINVATIDIDGKKLDEFRISK